MSKREEFLRAEKFAIYYGKGALDRLIQFDVVIIEPGHRTAEEIEVLKLHGTLVLAYVSVMEIHQEHPLRSYVKEDLYLREANPPYGFLIQKEYQNRIVGMDSSNWRGLLLHHIGRLITREGYDGVFLDTIGDVEISNIPNPMRQVDGAKTFVELIRSTFPNHVIVQNNGLEILCNYTAPYLDGIAWENPPLEIKESKQWVKLIAERLVRLKKHYPLRVITLFEGKRQENRFAFLRGRSFAQEHGFTAYFSPNHYLDFHM